VRASPHLVRRGAIFHFRIAVPRDLVPRIGKGEIKTTLRTTELLTARQRGRALSSALEAVFEEVRRMPELTRSEIENRVRAFFQVCLNEAHEWADILPQDTRSWNRDSEVEYLRKRIIDLKAALSNRDFTPALQREVLKILHPEKEDAGKGDPENFRYACALVLKAKIQSDRILAAELMGDTLLPTDPIFQGMRATGFPDLPGEPCERNRDDTRIAGATAAVQEGMTYEDLFHSYRGYRQAEELAPRTLLELDRAFRLGSELIQPKLPITQIKIEDIRAVRDLIARIPANVDKVGTFKGLSARQAVEANEKAGVPLTSPATQVKLFNFFMLPFRWAAKEGHIPSVPGASISVIVPKSHGNKEIGRKPFTDADLKLIFSSPLFTGCSSKNRRAKPGPYLFKDGWYWVPIIGFYTGMRLAEVVQLGTDDIQQKSGVWCISVRPGIVQETGEKKLVKNKSAIRLVPVSDSLIKLGFLDLVRHATKSGRLFPEIPFGHDGTPSKNFSKFWSRYGKAVGFGSRDLVFHSLRHTMADMTRDAKMNIEASTAMMGHTLPGIRAHYGQGMSVKSIKEEMDRIKPPVDLVALLADAQRGKVDMTGKTWQSFSRKSPLTLTSPKQPSILQLERKNTSRKAAKSQPKDRSHS
jgi:integrase